jgi:hypothetical protein
MNLYEPDAGQNKIFHASPPFSICHALNLRLFKCSETCMMHCPRRVRPFPLECEHATQGTKGSATDTTRKRGQTAEPAGLPWGQ